MENELKLEDLGYDAFFESRHNTLVLEGFSVARVIAEHKGSYVVKDTRGEYFAKIRGKQMFNALSREDYPAVGDWVAITVCGEEKAVINSVFPRKTMLKRKYSSKNKTQIIATNIDVAFIIESVDRDYNLNRLERYFAIANDGGVQPAIVLNKIDLISKDELASRITQIKNRFGDIDCIPASTITEEGLNILKVNILKRRTYCFLGSSGVGKSSLINRLTGEDTIKTKSIGKRTNRGKHTTTGREMYFLESGGMVIDNPGMREVGMADTHAGIDTFFDEITALAKNCTYVDCTHTHEPGCEIAAAIQRGVLDEERYTNYARLKKEAEYYETTELEKRQKDRQFGKFMKQTKEQFKRSGYKDY